MAPGGRVAGLNLSLFGAAVDNNLYWWSDIEVVGREPRKVSRTTAPVLVGWGFRNHRRGRPRPSARQGDRKAPRSGGPAGTERLGREPGGHPPPAGRDARTTGCTTGRGVVWVLWTPLSPGLAGATCHRLTDHHIKIEVLAGVGGRRAKGGRWARRVCGGPVGYGTDAPVQVDFL